MRHREINSTHEGIAGMTHILEFSSMTEAYNKMKVYPAYKEAEEEARGKNRDWSLGEFGLDCINKIKKGDSDFSIPKELQFITATGNRQKRRKKYTDSGIEVDVLRALTGSMTPFSTKTKVDSKGRNVRIIIAMTISANVDVNKINKFATACMAEAYSLSASGYMVSIEVCSIATSVTYGSNKNLVSLIKMKDAKEPFDYKRIATIMYPAFFRLFLIHSKDVCNERINSGYGYSVRDRIQVQDFMEAEISKDSVVFEFTDWKETGKINYKR